ncbi:MAG: acetate--CoA ligase family protein, partial [Anaerolineales bacterium]|nr:acetate--CoA ligase family protein [Anaerolineales bacterium]
RAAHIPDYRFPENAAGALAALYRRAQYLNVESPKLFEIEVDKNTAAELLQNAQSDGQGFLDQETTHQILAAYGLPVVEMRLTRDADQAVTGAEEVGYPVALKVASEAIPHKSDVGGVLLDLPDAAAVRAGFAEIMQRVTEAYASGVIEGVYVQRMLPEGQEVVVGAVQDAQFGGLVMFGSGGVEVEGLKDVAFALAPLTDQDVDYLLANTWAGKKLAGFRSLPAADREAVIDVLVRIAQLVADFPQIKEMDINPLRVLPAGEGAYSIDVRLRV